MAKSTQTVNGIPLSDYVQAERCKLGEIKWDARLVKATALKSGSRAYKQVQEHLNRVLYVAA